MHLKIFQSQSGTQIERYSTRKIIAFDLFTRVSNKCSLHGNADSKIAVFKDRYNLILQRLKRSALFANPTTGFQV